MTTTAFPDAPDRIRAAIDAGILKGGDWGDGTEAVCMMSALVAGADSTEDCVTAGFPRWIAELNVHLFDVRVGADDEDKARQHFALSVAEAIATPRDLDAAHDRFLIARLDTGEQSTLKTMRSLKGNSSRQIEAVERVVALLHRRLSGEDVEEEMRAARAAAYAAVHASARAAAYAAAAAAYAAAADAAAAACACARAAADVAARAAARADLIAALRAS